MLPWYVWVILFWLVCAAFVGLKMATAPDGWEDENGFHLGKPK